jgi:hypothetical protein
MSDNIDMKQAILSFDLGLSQKVNKQSMNEIHQQIEE